MPRPLIIAALLGASIGLPYLASHSPLGNTNPSSAASATPATAEPTTPPAIAPLGSTQLPTLSPPAPLDPANYPTIEQVLRFDITKEWVYRRWARKSTWPTDVGLVGVRVQLVTGTHPSALAGSLTYYFNAHDQVEHISFHGRTGDAAPLVAFLSRTYEFQPAAAPAGEQLYQVKRGRRVQSELRTRPEAVITSAAPHSNFVVELELARPNSKRLLPPHGPQLNIPPATASPSPAADNIGATAESGIGSYFEKGRYATPQEEGQVLWKRWPN